MSYQRLVIAGNLGRDPEMRYTPGGQPVTTFSVATNRRWTNQDGSRGEETVWFRVTAWGRLAEVSAEYLGKGRQVLVEGRLTPDKETGGPRVWTGQDGTPRASYEVTAERIVFLGWRGSSAAPQEENGAAEEQPAPEDDAPF